MQSLRLKVKQARTQTNTEPEADRGPASGQPAWGGGSDRSSIECNAIGHILSHLVFTQPQRPRLLQHFAPLALGAAEF